MTPYAQPQPAANGRKAFTLIELLVVMAIIGVLISLLMPSLQGVRSQAKLSACKSNHRQMYAATALFAADHGGNVPLSEDTNEIGLMYLIRRFYATTNNMPDGHHGLGRLWYLNYLDNPRVFIDPDWNCAGHINWVSDYRCIKINGRDQTERLLNNEHTVTGTYVFYGYQGAGSLMTKPRRLQPLTRDGTRMTALIMCRIGGIFNPDTFSHGDRMVNVTYFDGRVQTLDGVAEHRALLTGVTLYGNERSIWHHPWMPDSWWQWASNHDPR